MSSKRLHLALLRDKMRIIRAKGFKGYKPVTCRGFLHRSHCKKITGYRMMIEKKDVLRKKLEALYLKYARDNVIGEKKEKVDDLSSHCALLKVAPDTPLSEVKASYEKMMRSWESFLQIPLWKEIAEERRKEIQEAYDKILSAREHASAETIELLVEDGAPTPPLLAPLPKQPEGEADERKPRKPPVDRRDGTFPGRKAPTRRHLRRLLIGIALAAFAVVVFSFWPGLYHYESVKIGDRIYPLRINRLTSASTYYNGRHWITPPLGEQPPANTPETVRPQAAISPAQPDSPAAKGSAPATGEKTAIVSPIMPRPDQVNKTEVSLGSKPTDKKETAVASGAPSKGEEASASVIEKPRKSEEYSIQIHAFQDESRARALLRELKFHPSEKYIQKTIDQDKNVWYRVLIGHFSSKNQAKNYLKEKKILETYPNSFIPNRGKTRQD